MISPNTYMSTISAVINDTPGNRQRIVISIILAARLGITGGNVIITEPLNYVTNTNTSTNTKTNVNTNCGKVIITEPNINTN